MISLKDYLRKNQNVQEDKMTEKETIEFRKKMKLAQKVLDQLVFSKFNIPYDIKPEYTRFRDRWIFNLWVDVDVDRYVSFTPSFKQEYQDFIDLLDENINSSLRYVNLQNDFGGLFFDYINDDEADEFIGQLNQKLYRELENRYNARPNEIKEADIFYYLYKSGDENADIRLEALGNNIMVKDEETGEETQLVSCRDVDNIMFDIFNAEAISIEYESFICQ